MGEWREFKKSHEWFGIVWDLCSGLLMVAVAAFLLWWTIMWFVNP